MMPAQSQLRVATVQFQHRPSDKTYNLERIHEFITQAAQEKVKILVYLKCVLLVIGTCRSYQMMPFML